MSATIVDGNTIFVSAGGDDIGINKNATISFSGGTRTTSFKGSGNFNAKTATKGDWTITCSGLWDNSDAGQTTVDAAVFTSSRELTIIFPWDGSNYTGTFILSSAEKGANEDEDGTYNYEFVNAGDVTAVV